MPKTQMRVCIEQTSNATKNNKMKCATSANEKPPNEKPTFANNEKPPNENPPNEKPPYDHPPKAFKHLYLH